MNNKINNKPRFEKSIVLFALRCHYISIENGGLTKKGKGMLSPRGWRLWFKVICYFDKRYEKAMYDFLVDTERDELINKVFPS